jgi:methyl-accepting chemotaxis protein
MRGMTVGKKLWLMVALSIVALLVVAGYTLESKRQSMIEDRQNSTRFVVETAWGVIAALDKRVESREISLAEAQAQAIAQLKGMRYNEKEYFWINDMHPTMVMHPTKPELDGKDLTATTDPTGKALFVEFVKAVAQNGAGFVDYLWPRPGSDQPVPKISYVKAYQPWGWVVGSGVYIDDINDAVMRDLLRLGMFLLVVCGVVIAVAVVLSRSISRRLAAAVSVAEAVSQGRLGNKIEIQGSDEIANLLSALSVMERKLQERREADQSVAHEMSRLKCALDNVQVNVRVADNDGKVIYVNNTLRDTLRKYESAFKQEIPGFEAERVVGGSIGVFYADPQAALERLRNLKATTQTRLKLGGRQYDVVTTPIVSQENQRLGTVGQWIDLTEQLKAEEEISQIVEAAASGDFSQRIAEEGKQGFFLQLAQNMNRLLQTSAEGLSEVERMLDAISCGDLTEQISRDFSGVFGKLKDDANRTAAQLTDIIGRIKEAASTIDVASKEIASGNTDLSQRTEEQASSLEETASSMEELTATVRQNAENARQANQHAVTASGIAAKGGEVVSRVVDTMSSISESSKKIVDIIGVIDGIAFQTNILALNAAVEAARAGEQGRGFAVVASEVRNLAQRSAAAAKEIKHLITGSVEKVEEGAALVSTAGHTMEEIVTSVKRVTDIMAEVSAASAEQSTGIEQVNQAISQMDDVTQQNAALVEQAAAAAHSLEDQARDLSDLMKAFRLSNEKVRVPAVANRSRVISTKKTPNSSVRAIEPRARAVEEEWEEF